MAAPTFEQQFGKPPRPAQVTAAEWLSGHAHSDHVVLQAPTGSGKTLIGVSRILNSRRRGVYVCSTKSLQMQIIAESAEWNLDGKVVCLFGRDNYWCAKRVRNALAERGRARLPLDERRVLSNLPSRTAGNARTAPKDDFEGVCAECDVPAARAAALWARITAQDCTCYGDMRRELTETGHENAEAYMLNHLWCEHGRTWVLAKRARLFVVNMHLFFCYMAYTQAITKNDYVVFDEAHTISKNATPLYERELGHPFVVADVMATVAEFEAVDARLLHGAEPLHSAFERGCKYTPMRIAFLVPEVRAAMEGVGLVFDAVAPRDAMHYVDQALAVLSRLRGTARADLRRVSVPMAAAYPKFRDVIRRVVERAEVEPTTDHAHIAMEVIHDDFFSLRAHRPEVDAVVRAASAYAGSDRVTKQLHEALARIVRLYAAVLRAKSASREQEWTHDDATRFIVPTATKAGITYDATPSMIARALSIGVWTKLRGSMGMSATLADVTNTADPFDAFRAETGMDADVATMVLPESFDRTRCRLVAPRMRKFNFSAGEAYNRAFREEQIRHIHAQLAALPKTKSALVIATANTELNELLASLELQHTDFDHINFSDHVRFEAFRLNADRRAVVYGCDGLSTGVDLPGRLGLVVLTKPKNVPPVKTQSSYQEKYIEGGKGRYWEGRVYERNRHAFQSAGRLQRRPDDAGVILVLGDPGNDANQVAEPIRRTWALSAVERP